MSNALLCLKVFTVIYSTTILFLCFRSALLFGLKSSYLLIILFYLIFIFPYISDAFLRVDFKDFPGFYSSFDDLNTNLIFCLFIIYNISVFWFFRGKSKLDFSIGQSFKSINYVYALLSFLPLFIFAFAPNKYKYLIYGGDWVRDFSEIDYIFSSYLNIAAVLSAVLCSFLIFKFYKKSLILSILMIVILFFDFYINGKRGIVILSFVCLSLVSFFYFKRLKSLGLILAMFFLLIIYNSWYQGNVRDFNSDVPLVVKYENLRIDYSRDQRVKMAIYANINPEEIKILEYPGQSYLFYLTFYMPRELWLDKPLPYSQYFTSALYLTESKMWGWGMSTSIFDEVIANFGFFGLVFLPFFLLYLLRKSRKYSKYFELYTLFLILILFMLQMISFMFLYVLWIVVLFIFIFRGGKKGG